MLLVSLAVHLFVLTVVFSVPDIDDKDDYVQVKVKLGLKNNKEVASSGFGLGGSQFQPSYLWPSISDSEELGSINDTIMPKNGFQVQKQEERNISQMPFEQLLEPAAGDAISAIKPAFTNDVFEDGDEEGVVIGNFTDEDVSKNASYEQMLPLWLNKFRKYPDEVRNVNIGGVGEVFIKIDRSGKILLSRVIKSTGNPLLDKSLTTMLAEADPVLPVPGNYYPDKKTFSYKIAFEFKN